MKITSLALAATLGLFSAGAMADASTGTTHPAPKGSDPSSVGVPSGSGSAMPNGNTDGSATPRASGTSGSGMDKPQNGGNPEGSSMGTTEPQNTRDAIQNGGTGSEGGAAGGASK
ncbi:MULTISPECIES: hypothetical protein [unclassified Pseudomonas]|uniref:hypothetical protein n=1 Tax=unclassified Pseudomonas TaxID=196821 RepID=UPI000BCF25A9|nr:MULTISPECIES: hypothetical protein [unclassified Pseudomonas]PVZ20190.1 hypothetical protein F474_00786 [Pseudomonas sp. URIL14HWK12:I12]PVZ27256.1 hypothetical protein F470_00441 [Pseudomonas sp. URIL14HWK12:I10]PVZ38145.1 hypothetical protein F472_00786 [Pseudomonas sp. URIL14HWK12:I11]SNZ04425.1 hypothetical protein SAMN05660463_00618 [Pseudomonas sp. URIL14HWK12:I9]